MLGMILLFFSNIGGNRSEVVEYLSKVIHKDSSSRFGMLRAFATKGADIESVDPSDTENTVWLDYESKQGRGRGNLQEA